MVRNFLLFTVLFVSLMLGSVWYFSSGAAHAHESEPRAPSNAAATTSNVGEVKPATKVVNAAQFKLAESSGMVYAPRDVVDLTRLVLETTRDQTNHMTHYIELGTTVIVVLFAVLGAVGTAFGVGKISEINERANEVTQNLKSNMEGQVEALHKELAAHSELMVAKAEINLAFHHERTDMAVLHNAAKRIENTLRNSALLSPITEIRALADWAYAIKRTGDIRGAFDHISKALALAEKHHLSTALGLLNYNAACYASLLNKSTTALELLEQAISLNDSNKEAARDDPDFQNIRSTDKFKSLTQ